MSVHHREIHTDGQKAEEEKSINGLWNKKVRDISYESIPVDQRRKQEKITDENSITVPS